MAPSSRIIITKSPGHHIIMAIVKLTVSDHTRGPRPHQRRLLPPGAQAGPQGLIENEASETLGCLERLYGEYGLLLLACEF